MLSVMEEGLLAQHAWLAPLSRPQADHSMVGGHDCPRALHLVRCSSLLPHRYPDGRSSDAHLQEALRRETIITSFIPLLRISSIITYLWWWRSRASMSDRRGKARNWEALLHPCIAPNGFRVANCGTQQMTPRCCSWPNPTGLKGPAMDGTMEHVPHIFESCIRPDGKPRMSRWRTAMVLLRMPLWAGRRCHACSDLIAAIPGVCSEQRRGNPACDVETGYRDLAMHTTVRTWKWPRP